MVALFYANGEQITALAKFTQAPGGAMTSINDLSLGLPATVRNMSGDATYAMGRWAAGAIAGASTPTTLSEAGPNQSYHYVVFNKAASAPTAGTLACDAGEFTAPSYIGGPAPSSSDWLGHVTGSADLSFSATGAVVKTSLKVGNSASSGTGNFSAVVQTNYNTFLSGQGDGPVQPQASIALGQGGTGYDLAGGYIVAVSTGTKYTGVYRFHCK